MKIKRVEKIKELNYLHGYRIHYKTKNGQDKAWELVSRGDKKRLDKELFDNHSYTDGAMVFAVNEEKTHVVILREYRVSAGKYIYMLPAGLIDHDEDIKDAAVREFREETGLKLYPEYVEKERYTSVGIINEKVNIVYGRFSGEPTKAYQEESEDADIFIIDKEEAIRILNEEEVSIRSAMLLQQFFSIHPYFNG
ncbi:NUDIX hydrolase [Acidaminobacter sp. JC074]|uniref:NUDIX hydrolase n=1 Tax=Acidaminobacter sp. JC074 TaxID=2530199 RepID=UPI001F103118|nr:NUDIX hydrolase [Acidaminobacter sp. JC074]MCH4887345.1 NUDIX hydrolase [Acidaminobacter sp. JC074]